MNKGSAGANRYRVPFISLVPFLIIAFGMAWGILAPRPVHLSPGPDARDLRGIDRPTSAFFPGCLCACDRRNNRCPFLWRV